MVKLVVGNLPPSATNQSLKEIFHEYGDLQDYKLISNYGFVYLETQESANHAVHNLNGFEYRGFQVTVDFVGESKNKMRASAALETSQFPKPTAPSQKRFVPQLLDQPNPNPYNLNFSNGNSRSFDMSNEKNPNPYNLPMGKSNVAAKRPYNVNEIRNTDPYNAAYAKTNNNVGAPQRLYNMPEPRYRPQQFDEYNESMYSALGYGRNYGVRNEDPYVSAVPYDEYGQSYGDYSQQYDEYNQQYYSQHYHPEEDYYNQAPPVKRVRSNPFMDDGYGYVPRMQDYPEGDNRPYGSSQPAWVDQRQMPMKHSYLHACDEPNYRPRGRRYYEPKKSYIDEYEDDQDYTEVDPYPAYLKQYKK